MLFINEFNINITPTQVSIEYQIVKVKNLYLNSHLIFVIFVTIISYMQINLSKNIRIKEASIKKLLF